jgi:predicted alpha/beta-hydrolase family hydrolase
MSPLPELVGSEHDSVVNDGGFGALVHVPVDAVAELVDDRELLELETAELDMADELLVTADELATADELRTADDEVDTANELEDDWQEIL